MKLLFILDTVEFPLAPTPALARRAAALLAQRGYTVHLLELWDGQTPPPAAPGCESHLLAFGDGESVSEECYFGDTLYYVLEGGLSVTLEGAVRQLWTGDCLAVPTGTSHAVAAPESCKLLQITLS